jgi:hypothetical protein
MESTSSSTRSRARVGQVSAITPNQQPQVASHRPLALLLADKRAGGPTPGSPHAEEALRVPRANGGQFHF